MTVYRYMTKAATKSGEIVVLPGALQVSDPPLFGGVSRGGVGFAHNTIREYADEMLKPAIAAQ